MRSGRWLRRRVVIHTYEGIETATCLLPTLFHRDTGSALRQLFGSAIGHPQKPAPSRRDVAQGESCIEVAYRRRIRECCGMRHLASQIHATHALPTGMRPWRNHLPATHRYRHGAIEPHAPGSDLETTPSRHIIAHDTQPRIHQNRAPHNHPCLHSTSGQHLTKKCPVHSSLFPNVKLLCTTTTTLRRPQ
jgi:hypothetical protein